MAWTCAGRAWRRYVAGRGCHLSPRLTSLTLSGRCAVSLPGAFGVRAMSLAGTSRTWLIWRGCPLLNEKQTLFSLDLRLAASGAKRPSDRIVRSVNCQMPPIMRLKREPGVEGSPLPAQSSFWRAPRCAALACGKFFKRRSVRRTHRSVMGALFVRGTGHRDRRRFGGIEARIRAS